MDKPIGSGEEPVLLFDGVCHLCAGVVRFVLRHDRAERFRFASLQSEAGRRLAADHGCPDPGLDSVLLLHRGRLMRKSRAALHICLLLDFPWPLLALFLIVPRFIADAVYDFVGNRRYRWFGRSDTCMLPAPGLKTRFLDTGEAPEPGAADAAPAGQTTASSALEKS